MAVCAWIAPAALAANELFWTTPYSSTSLFEGNANGSTVPPNMMGTTTATVDPWGVAPDPATGKVYWAAFGSNTISVANLDGSGATDLITPGSTAATVSGPIGIAVDQANDRIYWSNWTGNKISWASLDGHTGGDYNTGTATVCNPMGVAIDQSANRLYWTNYCTSSTSGQSIGFAKLDNTGGGPLNVIGATVSTPEGLAIDPANGEIYWTNYAGSKISFAHLDGTGGQDLSTGTATVSSPSGIAIDPANNRIYWANWGGNTISSANADGSGNGTDLYATGSDPAFPAILAAPSGTSIPLITGATLAPTTLSCSRGAWGQDLLGAQLYRAPQTFSYAWSVNGVPVTGASGSSIAATTAGNYACSVTATNAAGSAIQTSPVQVVASPPAPPKPTASMSSAVHGSSATLSFSCSGVAGQSCSGTYAVTAHKTTCGSAVKAVSAAHKKRKPKCVPKVSTVNLGGGSYAVSAGHSTQTSFTVAHNGVALVFHFYRLPTTFTFAAFSSNAPSSRVVVFAYKRITSSLDNFQLAAGGSSTLVSSWPIKKIPSGGSVKVICHGGGCPFTQRVYRNKSHISVLQGARLHVGTTVQVIVNAPFSVGEVLTATIKSLAAPKEVLSCLPPGAGAPLKCTA